MSVRCHRPQENNDEPRMTQQDNPNLTRQAPTHQTVCLNSSSSPSPLTNNLLAIAYSSSSSLKPPTYPSQFSPDHDPPSPSLTHTCTNIHPYQCQPHHHTAHHKSQVACFYGHLIPFPSLSCYFAVCIRWFRIMCLYNKAPRHNKYNRRCNHLTGHSPAVMKNDDDFYSSRSYLHK